MNGKGVREVEKVVDLLQCIAIIMLALTVNSQRKTIKALFKQVQKLHNYAEEMYLWVQALNLLIKEVSGLGNYCLDKFGNDLRRKKPREQSDESCDAGNNV